MSKVLLTLMTRVRTKGGLRVAVKNGQPLPADVLPEEAARLERLGVLGNPGDTPKPRLSATALAEAQLAGDEPESEEEVVDFTAEEEEAIEHWVATLEADTPNADDTIALAEGDAEAATLLLAAEKRTRARSTVIAQLKKLAEGE